MDAWPEFADPRESLGMCLRAGRARLGLSQRGLAVLLDWDKSKLARWEAGRGPDALTEVQGLLRLLGYALVIVRLDGTPDRQQRLPEDGLEIAAVPDECLRPVEHVVDRAGRRFPAHLLTTLETDPPTHWWARYRGMPRPDLGPWTYRRQTKPDAWAERRADHD